ncbi:hypothetical protein OJ996_20755 [Luteolibacter sp. GHJ8]|jgi:hypothetical protein|uniref:Lipoprotein n=1 Tax=Luteolibacter rhizosphaerae TaxID=2989719 RepID=A0ABT3G848_9BACT|nr:hypothetical protein [Luteolibacter rhizosphaerae]MCW1916031.1 hypothetical protein [Luteolibacter rhizosphaerae]
MKLRLILPASAALFLAVSCTPYVEEPPQAPADPAVNKQQTEEEKQKIAEQREKKKKEAEELANKEKQSEGEPGAQDKPAGNPDADKTPPKKPEEAKAEIRVAKPVPGKPGFVFSPFNNKIIDVKGIPSGRLVADPTYPASEKKHFRVP